MIQAASLGGTYAVSGLVALLNASLAMTALRIAAEVRGRVRRRRLHAELMLGLGVMALCWGWGVRTVRRSDLHQEGERQIRMAAVQPNIPQVQKWSEAYRDDAYRVLQEQSELAAMSLPALMIWPETAIPDLLRIDPMAQSVVASLVSGDMMLLAGSMDFEQPGEELCYYNASFLIAAPGSIMGTYRKRHLVPFGEYLPFENQVPLIKRLAPLGFSCLPGGPASLLELPLDGEDGGDAALFSVLICFEDVFPYLARRDVAAGARFLVNQTNDAWFETSAASRQHMANAVFRAVENRIPLVRCANSGVTCFVDRSGRIVELLTGDAGRTGLKGFSVSELRLLPRGQPLTLYTRFGDWLFARPCAIMVLGLLLATALKWARQHPHSWDDGFRQPV